MAEEKIPAVDEVEKLLVIKQGRLKPANTSKIKKCFPGDTISMVGMDKLDALGQGKVTRDLKGKVPENGKRKAPNPQEVEFAQNPNKVLAEALIKLTSVLELLEKKLK